MSQNCVLTIILSGWDKWQQQKTRDLREIRGCHNIDQRYIDTSINGGDITWPGSIEMMKADAEEIARRAVKGYTETPDVALRREFTDSRTDGRQIVHCL